ncbi:MAG: nucleotidyl transferase AbiEii/AbiGii toxin family protein, partial [Candidatus Thermoplasmatota archaeon]
WSNYLVFKGGTALQKTGLITRFSEDLDFTEKKNISLKNFSDIVVKTVESYNYPVTVDSFTDKDITAGFRVKIKGPLYRNNRGFCSIRLEVSRREEVLLKPDVVELNPVYKDVLPYVIKIMDKTEIAAEKVRAVLTRDKVRDVYDLFRLLENNVRFDKTLIEKKLEYYDMQFDKFEFIERCRDLSERWNIDLESLMEKPPSKEKSLELIISEIKKV